MTKQWQVTVEGEAHEVSIEATGFLGRLSVTIDGDTFLLPSKFLTVLLGRRERLMLSDKLVLLVIKPFMRVYLVVGGKYIDSLN